MSGVIVVVSHPADVHATAVVGRLASWGRETYLLDYARFGRDLTLTLDPAGAGGPAVRVADARGVTDLTDATAVWWRRPQLVDVGGIADDDARGFAYGEWHAALGGLHELLPCPWMNPPPLDAAASHKSTQLAVARGLGLRVPETMMTSDPAEARAFVERVGVGSVVYKIFAATERVWRETRRLRPDDLALLDSLPLAPVIFQEFVPARADLRVTVVGDRLFPLAIDSSGTGYDADFRLHLARARTGAADLPEDVADRLRALMKRFGLVYGAVDLRLTPEGEYVFLEVNPAGEFLFAEHGSGLPLTDAVAGWLAAPG
ncbi:alpha-L-glutamate ligase [Cellulomonas sp. Y8]|uniref:alpha-L-glutamate ligase n=1 Tax=Cellulomonas sp. Y8 TaxID=2591145 RepID=UPI0011C7EF0E|nr:alpha-L-glutamate ligase [Cellulomonas sp. Y8]